MREDCGLVEAFTSETDNFDTNDFIVDTAIGSDTAILPRVARRNNTFRRIANV